RTERLAAAILLPGAIVIDVGPDDTADKTASPPVLMPNSGGIPAKICDICPGGIRLGLKFVVSKRKIWKPLPVAKLIVLAGFPGSFSVLSVTASILLPAAVSVIGAVSRILSVTASTYGTAMLPLAASVIAPVENSPRPRLKFALRLRVLYIEQLIEMPPVPGASAMSLGPALIEPSTASLLVPPPVTKKFPPACSVTFAVVLTPISWPLSPFPGCAATMNPVSSTKSIAPGAGAVPALFNALSVTLPGTAFAGFVNVSAAPGSDCVRATRFCAVIGASWVIVAAELNVTEPVRAFTAWFSARLPLVVVCRTIFPLFADTPAMPATLNIWLFGGVPV